MYSDAPLHTRCLRLSLSTCPHLTDTTTLRVAAVTTDDILADGHPWADTLVTEWTQDWSVPDSVYTTAPDVHEVVACPQRPSRS
ncbi:hypothetical protein [Allokutzneria multivorans]|uniref:hypothetical protein n=1 Tax=Allokutzneria multivorans TaxID=1142134 RepID=UPI0031E92766